MTTAIAPPPVVSVIIPARHCEEDLRRCLQGLDNSLYRDFEIIVVDDASEDGTTAWIDPTRARVEVMLENAGPAVARNHGARVARGEYLLFLDADICVRPETIGLVVETLAANPEVAAVFGSYDTEPGALNVLSQYRNLMHHFVHQAAREEAGTFWSGCGAMRRTVFEEIGGFEISYRRPCIEDIQLGVRLRKAGHRILLNKRVQVTHLKHWTFWGMVKADIRDRALPWSQLILHERNLPNDLNLSYPHRISALLACGLLGALLVGTWHLQALVAVPLAFLALIVLIDSWSQTRRVPTTVRFLTVLAVLTGTVLLGAYFKALVLIPLGLLGGILILNWRFYLFLARTRHPLFAALAVPLHTLYYLYSAATFSVALGLHLLGVAPQRRSSQPAETVDRGPSLATAIFPWQRPCLCQPSLPPAVSPEATDKLP